MGIPVGRQVSDRDDRLRFETVVANQAARFVNIAADQIDATIEDAQRCFVEVLDLDRSTIHQFVDETGDLVATHSWARPEFRAYPRALSARKQFPWALQKILDSEIVCFSSLDDLPAEAGGDIEAFRASGPKSNVTFPLIVSGKVVGALSFGAMVRERHWPEAVVNRLRLVAQIFAAALARKLGDEELRTALAEVKALQDRLQGENLYLRDLVKEQQSFGKIIGKSKAIQQTLAAVEQVARTNATVMLLGETGSGKELLASAIHELSPRRDRVMVRVNCAAIPTALIESELFGREKGAYTGALAKQIGRFELANGSTLFLDEVTELPFEAQAKLLRALQEREIERLGSPRPIKVDVRVIAASNRDIRKAVAEGRFRDDLFYRLNVFPISVPSLRERLDDIPLLANAFIEELSTSIGKPIDSISRASIKALQQYDWPGNIRELRNEIERAIILSDGPTLKVELSNQNAGLARVDRSIANIDSEHIRHVLDSTHWRVRGAGGAAEILGLKPTTLESRMAKLGLRRTT
jgi:transcriptional regulator with GAF, ATPase, and Fis domain